MPDVERAMATVDTKRAGVPRDAGMTSPAAIRAALTGAGYPAAVSALSGMIA